MGPKPAPNKEPRFNVTLLLATGLALFLIGGAVAFFVFRSGDGEDLGALTAEAEAYMAQLQLSEVEMEAADSFMQTTLVEIKGRITNNGNRPVRLVEVNCIFTDPYGQRLLRERVQLVRPRGAPLNPADSRTFRLAFDTIPEGWNQALPYFAIARIEFVQ
ncbi:MAG: hypothetical protein M9913_01995 [Bryobacteraceae bacterium]|nr:hypothetical protein [Solibacteraceae bacterium]MCL4840237.1 hypothetical protein [Bryobacteraceae bacterium]MCO5349675.1 hypothetical protein [Bryobacteraceae bacterium]